MFPTDCRIPFWPFVVVVKAGHRTRLKDHSRRRHAAISGGLESPSHAKSLRKQTDGNVSIIDGPYLEAKEHIGGFWILECADMDEALAWDAKPSSPAGFLSRCERSSKSVPREIH
jgi:hypothetical protein